MTAQLPDLLLITRGCVRIDQFRIWGYQCVSCIFVVPQLGR
jgi:hypothetical protein